MTSTPLDVPGINYVQKKSVTKFANRLNPPKGGISHPMTGAALGVSNRFLTTFDEVSEPAERRYSRLVSGRCVISRAALLCEQLLEEAQSTSVQLTNA